MRIILALAACLGALPAVAVAQQLPPAVPADRPAPPAGGMMRADANGDGVVTRQEALAQAAARFDRMDANRDGRLTGDELRGPAREGPRGDGGPPPPGGM